MTTLFVLWFMGAVFALGLSLGIDEVAEKADRLDFWHRLSLFFMSWLGAGLILGVHVGESHQSIEVDK